MTILSENICHFVNLLSLANNYCKVASFNTSRFEANAGFFRLLMMGIFDPYVL